MEEFKLRNQIVDLAYKLLEKHSDKFAKLDDDTVVTFLDNTLIGLSLSENISERFSGVELKITKTEFNNQNFYRLYASGIGNTYFKYFVSDLDAKTAYKFFQTDLMVEKELQDLTKTRDLLLRDTEK